MPGAEQESEAEPEGLEAFSRACLRIHANLNPAEVLQAVAEAARSLTGARYAMAWSMDGEQRVHDRASAGFNAVQQRRLERLDGRRFLESLVRNAEPEQAEFSQSLGIGSSLSAPIEAGDERLGRLWLAHGEGGQDFSRADEQLVVMIATQAAAATTNARRHARERQARADLLELIDTSPVGVVVFDAEAGLPVSVNQEALRLARGLRMPGRALEQLGEVLTCRRADGREIALGELPLAQALNTGETVRAEEIIVQTPDGRSLTTLVNATPIRSHTGAVESVVVTLQDLTPLEELERLRAEFLGMVSHELRVPLTSIKGSAATLLNDSAELDPAETRRFVEIIDAQADRMRGLISELLDLARIESGTLSVRPEPSDLAALVDEARNLFLGDGGSQRIEIDLGLDLPKVRADRRRIVQVLNNLFSNAAQHSESSSVIRVTAKTDDLRMTICVSDDGRGVEAQQLPDLFRKFSRLGSEEGGEGREGSGLGLAICKGIVEAHGGRIWAESGEAEPGTRFLFTLPLAEDCSEPGATECSPVPELNSSERTRVLVVDDDPNALTHLRNMLTCLGYTAIVTADPDEALDLVQTRRPELVLLDLVFPGADGLELMARILELAELPVLFVSGYGRDEIIARALDQGASDYLVKPVSPAELAARIRSALRKRQALDSDSIKQRAPFRCGDLEIDYRARRVTVAGRDVQLAPTEYELLAELSLQAGRVLTHELLLQRVWGQSKGGEARYVRAAVKRLRRKLGDDARHARYIVTVPRVGYRLRCADEAEMNGSR